MKYNTIACYQNENLQLEDNILAFPEADRGIFWRLL